MEIEILGTDTTEVRNPRGEMEPRTLVSFRDEEGRYDAIVIPVKEPSDTQIAEAIKKRRAERAKFKPRKIEV